MIKKENLINIGQESLKLILEYKGEVIYSSHESIKKGDIYLLGLNPGGEGSTTINEHLSNLITKETNSYLDEEWDRMINSVRTKLKKGEAPLQKRVDFLLTSLDYNTKEICASNLIFVTSKSADDINYGLAGYCWRFHEALLEIIKPKIILCFGISDISSYAFLHSIYQGIETRINSGHGNWECKAFTTFMEGRKTTIIGIPHLSYYNIIGKEIVINWIKSFLI